MQCIAIELARNVLGYADANSREMDEKTPHNVIDIMEEQKAITNMGGTMRLGAYECVLQKGSKAYQAYGQEHIQERHRHRYEFNNDYKDRYEAAGMKCVGINPESDLVEIVEIPDFEMVCRYTVPSGIWQYGTEPSSVVRGICESCHRKRKSNGERLTIRGKQPVVCNLYNL